MTTEIDYVSYIGKSRDEIRELVERHGIANAEQAWRDLDDSARVAQTRGPCAYRNAANTLNAVLREMEDAETESPEAD